MERTLEECDGCNIKFNCFLPRAFAILQDYHECPCLDCLVRSKCNTHDSCFMIKTYRGIYMTCMDRAYLRIHIKENV